MTCAIYAKTAAEQQRIGNVMRYVLILALMVLSHLDATAARAGRVEDRESLRRLPGVEVIVETLFSEEEAAGFSRDEIRTGVEVVLQSNGVRDTFEACRGLR